MTLTLTNSESQMWQRCRRKWWLSSYRRLGKDETLSVNTLPGIGNAYHAALEAYYGRGEHPVEFAAKYYADRAEEIQSKAAPLEDEVLLAQLDKERELVLIMLDGYMEWLADEGEDSNLDVYGAEERVVEPLTDDIELQGKIDARARYRSDPEVVLQIDHKTTGDLTSIPKAARVNQQFLTYDLLAFLRNRRTGEGERTDGVLINMARRVKRTARAKPPFYGRYVARHNIDELRAHWKHVVAVGNEIIAAQKRLDAGEDHHVAVPPTPTRDCSWDCPFAGPCLSGMFDSGADVEGYLASNFIKIDPLARYGPTTDA